MHDLLNNILKIISLVVHTIVQLFNERRGNQKIADSDIEKFRSSNNLEERIGVNDEKKHASKWNTN